MKKYLVSALLVYVVACGGTDSPNGSDQNESNQNVGNQEFSYEYSDQNCSTGEQAFNTEKELCLALMEENLNESCAFEARGADFINRDCATKLKLGKDHVFSDLTPAGSGTEEPVGSGTEEEEEEPVGSGSEEPVGSGTEAPPQPPVGSGSEQ